MIYLLTMLIYRIRGGLFNIPQAKTIGKLGLCYVMYLIHGKLDYYLLASAILFFVVLSMDYISHFDPFVEKPRYNNWYDKYIEDSYNKYGVVRTNLVGLTFKGLFVGLSLLPILGLTSLHLIISFPLLQYIGWKYDTRARNYAEYLVGLVIFIG